MKAYIIIIAVLWSGVADGLTAAEGLARYQAWSDNSASRLATTCTVTLENLPLDERRRRLSHFAAEKFPDSLQTPNSANEACKKSQLLLNEETATGAKRVSVGDVLSLSLPPDRRTLVPKDEARAQRWLQKRANAVKVFSSSTQSPPLSVLFEDDCMAIVCKPAGIHSLSWRNTLKRGELCLDDVLPLLLQPPLESRDALSTPLPRHRLDARVAGPVVVAKTKRALVHLGQSFEFGKAVKEYRAMLVGEGSYQFRSLPEISVELPLLPQLVIDQEIDGRDSVTEVSVLARTPCIVDGVCTDVALFPKTGRQHQLRRHCAEALGAPILGDDLYTGRKCDDLLVDAPGGGNSDLIDSDKSDCIAVRKRIGLFLYCRCLSIPHPIDAGRIVAVEIPEPRRFAKHRNKAIKGWEWQKALEEKT